MYAIMIKIASRSKRKDAANSAASRKAGRTGWGDEPRQKSQGRSTPGVVNDGRSSGDNSKKPSLSDKKSGIGLAGKIALGLGATTAAGYGIHKMNQHLKKKRAEQESAKSEV